MKRLLLLAALLWTTHPALAEPPALLCAAAKDKVRANSRLASEVAAVFGKADFVGTERDCVYPLKVLHYASANVSRLFKRACRWGPVTLAQHPSSAYVIQHTGRGLKPIAKFHEFTELGSWGAIIDVWPIEIGGDDAMAIKSGGTFQGYSSSHIDFFAFRADALVDLEKPPVVLSADTGRAPEDASKTTVVAGSWFIDPADKTALVVDYKIDAKGPTRVERVVWRLQDGKLVLTRGRVPPEVTQASGG